LIGDELADSWPEGPNGLITFDVPAGEHKVQLRMTDSTPARRIGTALSAVSVLLVAGLVIWPSRNRS